MSLPTLPPAPQGTETEEPSRWSHLIKHQFKPGHPGHTERTRRTSPEIKILLRKAAPDAVKTLCKVMSNRNFSSEARCMAAIIVLNRVYGKAKLLIDIEINGEIKGAHHNE